MVLATLAVMLPHRASHATTLDQLKGLVEQHGGNTDALGALSPGHPLVEALESKTLRKHRVTVPGSDAYYFASDDRTVVLITAGPEVVGRYLMPSVRGADFVTADGQPAAAGEPIAAPLVYSITDLGWFWLEPRITLTPASSAGVEITGARVDESTIQHQLRVDPAAAAGEGSTITFATLGAGLEDAERLLRRGESVKLTIVSGIYREGPFDLWCESWSDAARQAVFVIEGEGETAPVITGADDWSGGWEPVAGADHVYRKPWPHAFGLSDQNWARWGYLIDPRVARSEVVTVDGQILLPLMLEQFAWVDPDGAVPLEETVESNNVPGRWKALGIKSPSELLPETFGVVEAEKMIYVRPAEGVDLNAAAVEVSVRPHLLGIHGRQNVVLRGLTFRHAATFVGSHTRAVLLQGHNILVEDCRFEEHGSKALGIAGEQPTGITLRRCAFNGNGWQGLSVGYRVDNYVMEDCESSYNNWRGHTGLQYGWDAAGCKAFALDGQTGFVLRGHRAFANLTSGFWFDQSFTPRSPIQIEDSFFIGNRFGSQLYLEKLTGPVDVQRNVIWNDAGTRGIDGTSWNVNLAGNVLYTASDDHAAIYLHKRGTESEYANYSRDWTLRNNLVVSAAPSSPLLQNDCTPQQYRGFLDTLTAEGNVYHSVAPDRAFPLPDGGWGGLDAWRQATGQEARSTWADPQLAAAESFDWTVENAEVAAQLGDLPDPISADDRARLEHAIAQAERYLSITAAAGHGSGPAFTRARNAIENHWRPIDLAAVANRPLLGPDGWIGGGNALPHLDAGRHVFAGVPFDIPDPGGDASVALALRSEKMTQTDGDPLADSAELTLGVKAPAVYVLHGAGWIGDESGRVATYELVFADGQRHAVEVVPASADAAQPNIGEWYHAFPVFDNPATRHVSLLGHGQSPGATLYVLEIPNPRPEATITSLRMRSEPGRDTGVIVLAVTALSP